MSGIELIKQQVKPCQSFVNILGSEVHAMIVVPERAQRFINIAGSGMGRENSSQHIGIMLVIELADFKKVARKAVAFRGGVSVVQVRSNRGYAKAIIVILGQGVEVAHQNWLAVFGYISWPGHHSVEAPQGLRGQIRRDREVRR